MKPRLLTVFFATFFLTACAAQPTVKDVLADPITNLNIATSESKLPDATKNSLGIKMPGVVKKKVVLDVSLTNTDDGVTRTFNYKDSYFVLDNGLVRRLSQVSSNEIPTLTNFSLIYSVMPLISQSIWHERANADIPSITKNIKSVDRNILNPAENTDYVFEFSFVPEFQVANFPDFKDACKTDKWLPAATFHPQLPGDAIVIDCESFGINQQLFRKIKLLFIKEFGITIDLESSTSGRKRTYRITDVRAG